MYSSLLGKDFHANLNLTSTEAESMNGRFNSLFKPTCDQVVKPECEI